jgi:REP element-mobilizing transposase RayT
MPSTTNRKYPAHWFPQPNHPSPIIFLTCCTKNRRRWMANPRAHSALLGAWESAADWSVGRYVLMPDHLHLFCAPMPDALPLNRWIAFWRSLTTSALGAAKGWLWQREFWDHQLRRADSYNDKWEYVRNNPVRANLVSRTEDWQFQGELNRLEWSGTR